LQTEFANVFHTKTVEQFAYSSYEELAAHATVREFLPLLAERFARHRLPAIAKTKGKLTKHELVMLFLCNHNAGRSQMAMGLFNHLAGGAVVWSGGSEPTGKINPAAVAVMAERRTDISGEYPKPWTGEIICSRRRDCQHGLWRRRPRPARRRYHDWDLDDPAGKDVAEVRLIRDEIERRVRELLDDLRIPYRS
jgi:arsenate reductase (thioredoxin)